MSLIDRLNKKTKLEGASTMSSSSFMQDQTTITTPCPMLNVAFSGRVDGGFGCGLTTLAGPSRHFKSNLGLFMAKCYLDQFEDAIIIFYDSEYGSSSEYFDTFGIDPSRVAHRPIDDIEDIKVDLSQTLEEMKVIEKETKQKVRAFIFVDSIGNLASRKETEDALDGKTVADMTRAKQLKSLFRIVTPKLNKRDVPMFVVNHTYDEIASGPGAPKKIIGGGCLVAGSLIQRSDGEYCPVENFQVGDMVKTMMGDKPVTHVWNPDTLDEGEPECYEVEFEDGTVVTCSDKHKFMIDGQWVEAKYLVEGDDVYVV